MKARVRTMRKNRRSPAFAAASVFALAASMALIPGGDADSNPLPGFANRVLPVVHFMLDSSGSMGICDGGTVTKSEDLTPVQGGTGYLYDPLTDGSTDHSGTGDGSNGCADNATRSAMTTFPISRMEALKLALSKMLDVDGNGTIDESDEVALRAKIGLSRFDTSAGEYLTHAGSLMQVGSRYADVWNTAKAFAAAGGTPSGPALAGARALNLSKCYDGDAATSCELGPDQNDEANGNDLALACRDYYVVFLTDGEPTVSSTGIDENPIPVSSSFRSKTKVLASEIAPPIQVRTIAIGFGNDVNTPGNARRGVINCTGFFGSDTDNSVADANKDGDDDHTKMSPDADPANSVAVNCTNDWESLSDTEEGYGNGFFASDADELAQTFRKIMNAISAGTFSRSPPSISSSGVATAQHVYGAFFDVEADALDWRGHLRKYRFNPEFRDTDGELSPRYVDCDSETTTSDPLKPCWDAGGWYGGTNLSPGGSQKGLYEREWITRRYFAANVLDATFDYKPDLGSKFSNGWKGVDSTRPATTVLNVIPALASANTVGDVADGSALAIWLAMSTMKDDKSTFDIGDTLTSLISGGEEAKLTASLKGLNFASGRPTSTFADDTTMRCGAACTDSSLSPKLGDSFNSRPVIVGPPLGIVSDPDYIGEFRNRPLAKFSEANLVVQYANGTQVSPCKEGIAASDCTVKDRRTAVYLAANDGTVHAYDDETGEELWAFLPPNHMPRLKAQRQGRRSYIDGLPVVRDVKFPCERESNGDCKTPTGNEVFEDGKWHTLLILNQGVGGNFFLALDITNPVRPDWIWESRHPNKMGLTIAPAAVGEIPPPDTGYPDKDKTGVVVFAPGGLIPNPDDAVETLPGADDTKHGHMHTLKPFNGEIMKDRHTDPHDLKDNQIRPYALVNGQTGAVRPVDGDLDGDIDRAYFGDRQGRLWKVCKIKNDGDFELEMFFDPAVYDCHGPEGTSGCPTTGDFVGQPREKDAPTKDLADANARKQLRGPVFFPPDVTRNQDGYLIVGFGSGNILDPLGSPEEYNNLIWAVTDDPTLANDSCGPALARVCDAGATGSLTITWTGGDNGDVDVEDGNDSGTAVFDKLVPLNKQLTSAPFIFNKFLFYSEFEPNPDLCPANPEEIGDSRVIALNTFTCADPGGDGPFTNADGTKTSQKEFVNTLITGVELSPTGDNVFITDSKGGTPGVEGVPDLKLDPAFAGWKQKN